jgi:hypothetical protein
MVADIDAAIAGGLSRTPTVLANRQGHAGRLESTGFASRPTLRAVMEKLEIELSVRAFCACRRQSSHAIDGIAAGLDFV